MANDKKRPVEKPWLQQVVEALPDAFDKTREGYQEGVNDAYRDYQRGSSGALTTALVMPWVKGARGLAQDIVGDPVTQTLRAVGNSSSGGELPASAKTATPKKSPPVVTRPKDSRSLYSDFNAALIRSMMASGGVSLRQMGALANTVPQAPKPMSPVEVAQQQFLQGIDAEYAPAIAQAEANGDFEGAAGLYKRRNLELFKLFEPEAAYMQNITED